MITQCPEFKNTTLIYKKNSLFWLKKHPSESLRFHEQIIKTRVQHLYLIYRFQTKNLPINRVNPIFQPFYKECVLQANVRGIHKNNFLCFSEVALVRCKDDLIFKKMFTSQVLIPKYKRDIYNKYIAINSLPKTSRHYPRDLAYNKPSNLILKQDVIMNNNSVMTVLKKIFFESASISKSHFFFLIFSITNLFVMECNFLVELYSHIPDMRIVFEWIFSAYRDTCHQYLAFETNFWLPEIEFEKTSFFIEKHYNLLNSGGGGAGNLYSLTANPIPLNGVEEPLSELPCSIKLNVLENDIEMIPDTNDIKHSEAFEYYKNWGTSKLADLVKLMVPVAVIIIYHVSS